MKKSILFLLIALSCQVAWSQADESIWTTRQTADLAFDQADILHAFATDYRMVELDATTLEPSLLSTNKSVRTISLPLPDGTELSVDISPVSVMAPGLADRYPGIQTYKILPKGKTIYGGRVGWTAQGLHATLRTNEGTYYIDPYLKNDNRYYVVYDVAANINPQLWSGFECGLTGENDLDIEEIYAPAKTMELMDKGLLGEATVQRKYRLAMACTGEFSNFHGGTTESSMAAIVTIVNRVNEVYGRELAIQLELIANNDTLIFLNPATDPYNNQTDDMLDQNPGVLDARVTNAAYDIGHVISTGPSVGQGVASLRGVCIAGMKGRATSTRATPQGDPFVINILCHEMGHQFGATHVQSGCQNVSIETAVEPGGGTTIMGYAGICPAGYNIQTNSDDYYNNSSLAQILNYTRNGNGNACAQQIDEGNSLPEVTLDYVDGFFIPISTPFELTASASDMEDDGITYSWEQRDINASYPYDEEAGNFGPFPGSPVGDSPLFRSLPPTDAPNRVFPSLDLIINNQTSAAQVLPTYSRNMTFRCTVRDNHPTSGGIDWKQVAFRAAETAGPFVVTHPNSFDDVWTVGDYTEVTWDVANTDGAVVNCQRVDVRLSTDGGFTYPITLLEDAPNSGSAFVTVPDEVGNDVRVRVEAANNIFFDISNRDFTIEAATEAGYTLSHTPLYQQVCVPQEATINFETASILDYDGQIDFAVTSALPDGITATFTADNVQVGESNSLTVVFDNTTYDGLLTVDFSISAAGQETSIRSFNLEIVNPDFSALTLLSPANGMTDIVLETDFSWGALPNAQLYDFELATSPLFGESVIESSFGTSETSYSNSTQLEFSTLFYWRIRPINECGAGDWSVPYTFHTQNTICEGAVAADVPVLIPGTGPPPTVESKITISSSGSISDINIPNLTVRYLPIQNIEIRLISPPPSTEVLLYGAGGLCFGTEQIDVGFDDDAPTGIMCPPTGGTTYQPLEPLSALLGENTQGEWTLQVKVIESGFGQPGGIDGWEIEFCAEGTPSAPTVANNLGLCIPPGASDEITPDLLQVNDDTQNASELEYTIVTLPSAGSLFLNETELEVGSTFSQSSINAGILSYANTDNTATNDNFNFVVQDGTGGHLQVTQFDIVLDPVCEVGTDDIPFAEQFRLYPNPSRGEVFVEWGEVTNRDQQLRVFNLQGQLLWQNQVPSGTAKTSVDFSNLPAGVYIIQVGEQGQRVVIE